MCTGLSIICVTRRSQETAAAHLLVPTKNASHCIVDMDQPTMPWSSATSSFMKAPAFGSTRHSGRQRAYRCRHELEPTIGSRARNGRSRAALAQSSRQLAVKAYETSPETVFNSGDDDDIQSTTGGKDGQDDFDQCG